MLVIKCCGKHAVSACGSWDAADHVSMWRWRVAMHAAFACSVRVCDMPFCVYFFSIVVVLTIDPAKFTVVSTRVTGPFSSCCGHRHLYFQLNNEMFMKCAAWYFEPAPLALSQLIARSVLGSNCVVRALRRVLWRLVSCCPVKGAVNGLAI